MAQCDTIIKSNQYSLETDYKDLWEKGNANGNRNEHGVESIFEITYAPSEDARNPADWAIAQRGEQEELDGLGLISPTLDLLDEFEKGDPRILSTFLLHGDSLPQHDSIGGVFAVNVKKSACNLHMMLNAKVHRPLNEYTPDIESMGDNYIVIRYAEVLLMYAEAANELGMATEALEKLNLVRKRARHSSRHDDRLGRVYINFSGVVDDAYPTLNRPFIDYVWEQVTDNEILPDRVTADKNELRHLIWHERRVELALEGNRFFDLTRQSKVEPYRVGKTLRAFAFEWNLPWKGGAFQDGKHEVFPIPGSEVYFVGPEFLPQNNGY